MFNTRQMDNHDDIRAWAEARGGRPALPLSHPDSGGDEDMAMLAFAFDEPGEHVREISWTEWFTTFDANRLSLWAQDHGTDGGVSRYYKIVQREGYTAGEGQAA